MRCPKFDRKGRRCLKGASRLPHLHVYEPLRQVGRKYEQEQADLTAFRLEVEGRAGGLCDARFVVKDEGGYVCAGSKHAGEHAHHLFPEDRDCGVHDADRALWLCPEAHRWIHDNPAAAQKLDLLRPLIDETP